MARVTVLGATGQLGTDLCQQLSALGHEVAALTHRDLEVCDAGDLADRLTEIEPEVVINTAAFHKVEACEEDIERAFAVNCYAVRNLARTCNRIGACLVHMSTDYVFGGEQKTPYREGSPLGPVNVYGVSKAAGEYFVRSLSRRYLLVRSSGLYGIAGSSGKGGNFVETMLRLGRERGAVSVVTDQVLSPTYTWDLASKITELVGAGAEGMFHVTNDWACSWYEFARSIFELADPTVAVRPTTTDQMESAVTRPSYSVLENHRLREKGFATLRPGPEALAAYLKARVAHASPPADSA